MAGQTIALVMMLGLGITAIGAGTAARGVFITEKEADDTAATKWGGNDRLRSTLLKQSTTARNGLRIVTLGTMIQIVATALPFFVSP